MAERCKLCGAPLDNDGRCVSVLCLRAQVARLEAANGAKNAKLLAWAGNLGLWFDDPKLMELADKMVELATSDHAGKGWLPPDKVEQVRETLQAWFDWENDGTGQADTTDYDEEGAKHLQLLMANTRAALDALKGVE